MSSTRTRVLDQFNAVEQELKTKLEEAATLASTLRKLSFEFELPFNNEEAVRKQLNTIQYDIGDTWKSSSEEDGWQSSGCWLNSGPC